MGSSCLRTKLLHWSESRFHLHGPAQPLGKVSCLNSIRSARPWFSNRRSSRLKNSRCRPSSRHPIVLTPALRRMTHRSGHERMRPGHHQFMMQRVAKTARLINAMDRMPSVHLGPNPVEQSCAGEALPSLDVASAAMDRRHRIIQIHIQAKLENLPRSRIVTSHRGVRLIVVMKGWGCFIFHNLRVPCRHTPCNPSWHLTAPFAKTI